MNVDLRGPEGYELARRALEDLATRGLMPSPENYIVWTTHLADANPALSEAIARIEVSASGMTDAALSALYIEHCERPSFTDQVYAASGMAGEHLKTVMHTLAEVGSDTAAYGATLDGAADALAEADGPAALSTVVGGLVQATASMRARTRELEEQLADTSQEMKGLRTSLEQARAEALTDPLTGVANRKHFDLTLKAASEEARRDKTPLSVIIGDIDHFKRVNDTWGHQTGDQIIRFVASVLTNAAAKTHLVARYGGEEFAIVMPNTSLTQACAFADDARASIERKRLKRKSTSQDLGVITVSFGVAELAGDEPISRLIERADKALYDSKHAGRNTVSSVAA